MTFVVKRLPIFSQWLKDLNDATARRRILARLTRLELGNYGDVKWFDGIGEMRIDYGPGYRVYFQRRKTSLVILLCGGDKSTQRRDIRQAIELAATIEDDE